MSYPPRPPMGMGMPPMMGQGYGYPPMGMMQMRPMGMIPPGMPPQQQQQTKKMVPQDISKDGGEKPPVTTVFVGNISERAPDPMIRQMLNRCGNVLSWKRVQGASGKLQAFGFCEYEEPEATLRCIRLLNEWDICGKKLVVKVDAKTKSQLDEWKEKKTEKNGTKDEDLDVDEFAQREDRVATAGLDAIMREYSSDLQKLPLKQEKPHEPMLPPPSIDTKKPLEQVVKDEGLDGIGLEEDTKNIINREIGRFRNLHKGEEHKEDDDKEAYRRRQEERERERERRRLKELREQEKTRERERERREKEKEREKRRRSRSRSKSRSRSRSRERREREKKIEDEEDAYERRKLERKQREQEAAYQERLKNWEARERKKSRDTEKEREKEEERRQDEMREARRLREFLEDYDDERDDPKYYRGGNFQRRLKEREKEMEADTRDRGREKEELEEIRRKLQEEGHPDPEAEMARIEKEREEHLLPKLKDEEIIIDESPELAKDESPEVKRPVNMHPTLRPVDAAPSVSSQSQSPSSDGESPEGIIIPEPVEEQAPIAEQSYSRPEFDSPNDSRDSFQKEFNKRKKLTVKDVFNEDEEGSGETTKKRKLIPLDYSEEEKAALALSKAPTTVEEKRKHIKNLIERIPTGKDELFAFGLDWTMVDSSLMDRRIKPWVNKKIVEYIGEEEPTLTEFICQKVMAHSRPDSILTDVAMVLDDEAEVFVVKMWRLLIYETEAKKLGLVK